MSEINSIVVTKKPVVTEINNCHLLDVRFISSSVCSGDLLADYADNGDYWRSWYEMEGFEQECERLWQQLRPLYEQLHAYTLRKLKQVYADNIEDFPSTGHIPAHLLGQCKRTKIKTSVATYPFNLQYSTHFGHLLEQKVAQYNFVQWTMSEKL